MSSTRFYRRILITIKFSQQILGRYSNIKFYENSFRESRDVPYGRTEERTKGQTDIKMLIVDF
jgi:hypothetical protein